MKTQSGLKNMLVLISTLYFPITDHNYLARKTTVMDMDLVKDLVDMDLVDMDMVEDMVDMDLVDMGGSG